MSTRSILIAALTGITLVGIDESPEANQKPDLALYKGTPEQVMEAIADIPLANVITPGANVNGQAVVIAIDAKLPVKAGELDLEAVKNLITKESDTAFLHLVAWQQVDGGERNVIGVANGQNASLDTLTRLLAQRMQNEGRQDQVFIGSDDATRVQFALNDTTRREIAPAFQGETRHAFVNGVLVVGKLDSKEIACLDKNAVDTVLANTVVSTPSYALAEAPSNIIELSTTIDDGNNFVVTNKTAYYVGSIDTTGKTPVIQFQSKAIEIDDMSPILRAEAGTMITLQRDAHTLRFGANLAPELQDAIAA